MQKRLRLSFSKGDWSAIAAVLLLAAATLIAYLPNESTGQTALVQVRLEGSLIHELTVDEDREFIVSGKYENTIRIRNGKVSIVESDCPGTDCVHSGSISSPGRSIVCLPNRVEVRIVGAKSDVDFVVR